MKRLSGSIVALITPFTYENTIDFAALDKLVDFHLENGTDGLLYNGTTAESPTITLEEFEAIGSFICNKVNGRIPVIAGVGENDTQKAIQKIEIAERAGADYLLAVSPAYNKPSSNGIKHYYGALAAHTALPIIMYNVPGRTGSNISVETLIELGQSHANIMGVKEASGNMSRYLELIENAPEGFLVFAGDDDLAVPMVLMGGAGCISVVANQIPAEFSKMITLALKGESNAARELHYQYQKLMKINFIESNPVPVKTSLAKMGFCRLVFRSPLCTLEIQNQDRLYAIMESYNLSECRIPALV